MLKLCRMCTNECAQVNVAVKIFKPLCLSSPPRLLRKHTAKVSIQVNLIW